MKKILPTIVSAILAGAMLLAPACTIEETAEEEIEETAEGEIEETVEGEIEETAEEGFYKVSPELTAKLEQICLADSRVQELIEGREYSFTVDGHTVEIKEYSLNVGARLKDDTTFEQLQDWLAGGKQDPSIIKEYVGVLNIGYNDEYDIVIDLEKEEIQELTEASKSGAEIPEATAEDKQRAVTIALADATVQQILEGKEYEIAPDGEIGVWHSGQTKLGVCFEIAFDKTYTIDCELPRYQGDSYYFSGEVDRLFISVLLEENRVATILPM